MDGLSIAKGFRGSPASNPISLEAERRRPGYMVFTASHVPKLPWFLDIRYLFEVKSKFPKGKRGFHKGEEGFVSRDFTICKGDGSLTPQGQKKPRPNQVAASFGKMTPGIT